MKDGGPGGAAEYNNRGGGGDHSLLSYDDDASAAKMNCRAGNKQKPTDQKTKRTLYSSVFLCKLFRFIIPPLDDDGGVGVGGRAGWREETGNKLMRFVFYAGADAAVVVGHCAAFPLLLPFPLFAWMHVKN